MKMLTRIPKLNEKLHKELINNGWTVLKEPGNLAAAMILSIPFMAINLFIAVAGINIFSSLSLEEFGFTADSFSITINLSVIIAIILFVIFHELLHVIFVPNFTKSGKTYIGLSLFGGFALTEEELSKRRFILITIAPFLIISIMLPLLLGYLGSLTSGIKVFVMLNAMASSVDMLNMVLVLKQVPPNATLTNNGPKTYWRKIKSQ